jgi:hypothetical protein
MAIVQSPSNREAELPAPTRIGSGDLLGGVFIGSMTVWVVFSGGISKINGYRFRQNLLQLLRPAILEVMQSISVSVTNLLAMLGFVGLGSRHHCFGNRLDGLGGQISDNQNLMAAQAIGAIHLLTPKTFNVRRLQCCLNISVIVITSVNLNLIHIWI